MSLGRASIVSTRSVGATAMTPLPQSVIRPIISLLRLSGHWAVRSAIASRGRIRARREHSADRFHHRHTEADAGLFPHAPGALAAYVEEPRAMRSLPLRTAPVSGVGDAQTVALLRPHDEQKEVRRHPFQLRQIGRQLRDLDRQLQPQIDTTPPAPPNNPNIPTAKTARFPARNSRRQTGDSTPDRRTRLRHNKRLRSAGDAIECNDDGQRSSADQ